MPELPEVTTTVRGLNEVLAGLSIRDVWSDYHVSTKHLRTDNIKNRKFFEHFKKEIVGEKFLKAERRGKNILIHLSGGKTILIHMKMTGHLLYGQYRWDGTRWTSTEKLLADPFNQFVHLAFSLSDGKHLAFSDMRKFAKVTLFETGKRHTIADLSVLGPEPLEKEFTTETLERQLAARANGKIKSVLMDQSVVAGIGNIYSDEILWAAGIHPERPAGSLSAPERKRVWTAMKEILAEGIELGGDSMSDYRNIRGERGNFQNSHKAYRRTKQKCGKRGCGGTIVRKVIGGRSAHFCDTHQK
jgi:formamidopyrimidine-DNA glycosylase